MHRSARARFPLAALFALCLLATACSVGARTGSGLGATSNFSTTQVTTAPARAGLSSLSWWGDYRAPYSLDPLKTADYPEETILGNVCEPLLRTAADYSLHPGIAKAWRQPDATHLVLDLDPRAKFSDGRAVTTDDVVYSLKRNQDPAAASNYADSYTDVSSVEASGASQVTVSFSRPDYLFVHDLGILAGAVVEKSFAVRHGRDFGTAATGVMCSGPYTVASFDGTNSLVLKRNPRYWDPAHAARTDTVTFKFIADPAALANALSSGGLQGAFDLPASAIAQLRTAKNGRLYVGAEGSTTQNIDLVVARFSGGLADARVRQALSLAIDRKGIAKTLFDGAADPLYAVAGPGFWADEPTAARTAYAAAYGRLSTDPDPARASRLVKQAGATGKQITLAYAAGSPSSTQIAQVLQRAGEGIGLKMKIVGLPDQQYGSLFTDPKARAGYDSFLTINYLEFPQAATMYASYATKSGAQNFNGYRDPRVERALAQAQGTQDPGQRADHVAQAQQVLATSLPWIPIVQPRALLFQNDKVTGAPLTFSYMSNAWAAPVGAP